MYVALADHLGKLKAFKLIAEAGKLSEAAKRLHLSQPSLTRMIHGLEDAIGQKLFHRSRQGVALTRAGQLLLDYSSSMLRGLEDLETKLKNPDIEEAGVLRIGSYDSLAEYLWPEFVMAFKQSHPQIKLSVQTSNGGAHQKALEDGRLDILVDAEPRILGDFTSWVLYRDRFDFYGLKGVTPAEITPETIGDLPLLYCPAAFDEDNKSLAQHLEQRGYFFKDKMELDSFTAVRTFCRAGVGIAVLPQRLAEGSGKQIVNVNLKGFPSRGFGVHSICATVRSSRADDSRIRLLVKALRDRFKEDAR